MGNSRKPNVLSEEWPQYQKERNRLEARTLKICGYILMVYVLWREVIFGKERYTPVIISGVSLSLLLAVGAMYELYFVLRAYQEKEDLRKHELQLLAAVTMGVACFIVYTGKCNIETPVFTVNLLTFLVGYEMREAGRNKI